MKEYQPRILPRTREYPGYQFYARLEYQNQPAEKCFCFAALCIIDWLKKRLHDPELFPDEIKRLPAKDQLMKVTAKDFLTFSINAGFSANVVSLPDDGLWSLRLKEPDSDTESRKAIPGRQPAFSGPMRQYGCRHYCCCSSSSATL